MEKPPQFIKEFSKEESPEERQQAAQAIRAKRGEYFTEKKVQTERQHELQGVISSEHEQILAEQLEKIRNLETEIDGLSTSRLGKLRSYFELRKLRTNVAVKQKAYNELGVERNTDANKLQVIADELGTAEIPPALQEARAMLDDFYKKQKEKWANSDYTKEDIVKYFSAEHLASLPLEEYALLLKRFPSEMVTHVTRQGVRDHYGHGDHTKGMGEYQDGFMKMLADGKLRSSLAVYLIEDAKNEAVAKFLNLESFESKEQALEYIEGFTTPDMVSHGTAGLDTYGDRTAIHFAAEEVADAFYGSEKGNEIFVAYPSAFIASQYYFQGGLVQKETWGHADQWVWAKEEEGMDLDAGIVFIPDDTRVDAITGSCYELDENKKRVVNQAYIDAISRLVETDGFKELVQQVSETSHELTRFHSTPLSPEQKDDLQAQLKLYREQLEQKLGITDWQLAGTLLHQDNLQTLLVSRKRDESVMSRYSLNKTIQDLLEKEGILYLPSQNTVEAQEFWENYFNDHPDKRPSKVVYYGGDDPTQALRRWRQDQDIQKKSQEKQVGFTENDVYTGDNFQKITRNMDRFRNIAENVIENYFSSTARAAA